MCIKVRIYRESSKVVAILKRRIKNEAKISYVMYVGRFILRENTRKSFQVKCRTNN